MNYRCEACHAEMKQWSSSCAFCGTAGKLLPFKRKIIISDRFAPLGTCPADMMRVKTGNEVLDKFFGGGIPRRQCAIIFGKGSSGKTALAMEIARHCDELALWATAEEIVTLVDSRAIRYGQEGVSKLVYRLETNDIDGIERRILEIKPALVVIDSWQRMGTATIDKDFGSKQQMMYVYSAMRRLMCKHNFAVIMIAHATEDGVFDGQHELIHDVDGAVFRLSHRKDTIDRYLRVDKSRFCKDGKMKLTMDDAGRLIPVILSSKDPDDEPSDPKPPRGKPKDRSASKQKRSGLYVVRGDE